MNVCNYKTNGLILGGIMNLVTGEQEASVNIEFATDKLVKRTDYESIYRIVMFGLTDSDGILNIFDAIRRGGSGYLIGYYFKDENKYAGYFRPPTEEIDVWKSYL